MPHTRMRALLALALLLAPALADAQTVRTTILPARTVPGSQVNVTISAATGLTVPVGATYALIQAQGSNNTNGVCLFWRDDGTNPTNAAGQALAANQTLPYTVTGMPIKLIAASGATCTMSVSYYAW